MDAISDSFLMAMDILVASLDAIVLCRKETKTYVKSTVNLSENQYIVIDTGHCVESHTKLWGSEFGPFYFDKI